MKFTVAAEQEKFFATEGYIEFENLLSPKEAESFISSIEFKCQSMPGYSPTCLLHTLPKLLKLIQKNNLASFVYQLIHKKPLRLAYDHYFNQLPPHHLLKAEECGLLLYLSSQKQGHGIYFRQDFPEKILYTDRATRYLFLVFSTKQLHDSFNPVVYR